MTATLLRTSSVAASLRIVAVRIYCPDGAIQAHQRRAVTYFEAAMVFRFASLLLAGLGLTPGIVAGQSVPATNRTVDAELDTSIGNGDHMIYVNNRSSVEIIVTSVRLMGRRCTRAVSRHLKFPTRRHLKFSTVTLEGRYGCAGG